MSVKPALFAAIFVTMLFVGAFGQGKRITENEFDLNAFAARQNAEAAANRFVTLTERFRDKDSPAYESETRIVESLDSQKSRQVITRRNSEKTSISEWIRVNDLCFTRDGSSSWARSDRCLYIVSGVPEGSVVYGKPSFRVFRGSETAPTVYEKMQKYEQTDLHLPSVKYHRTQTFRVFLDDKGNFLKSDSTWESDADKGIYRDTTTFEYDLNLKIEAPIK